MQNNTKLSDYNLHNFISSLETYFEKKMKVSYLITDIYIYLTRKTKM